MHTALPRIQLTLCLIERDNAVLLGMKKRGFGAGKWNGFGGKVMAGETVVSAAHREMHEECGLTTTALEKIGELDFIYPDKIHETHIFLATACDGEPIESDEMYPQWFSYEDLPFDRMWPDDRYWFPLFINKQAFRGRFVFNEVDAIVDYHIEPVAVLSTA